MNNVKKDSRPDVFNLANIVTFYSSEFGWKRKFSDYYSGGGIVTSSSKYLVILLQRNSGYDMDESLNVMKGYYGPPPTIYFIYNTAKIGYKDIYFLDRKTGETIKRFRFHGALFRAFYNSGEDAFYFRFTDDDIYRRLKLD